MKRLKDRLQRLEERSAPRSARPDTIILWPGKALESDIVSASGAAGIVERLEGESVEALVDRAAGNREPMQQASIVSLDAWEA